MSEAADANRPTNGRAVEELAKTAAAAAQRRAADAAFECYKEAADMQIAEETNGDMDQVQGVRTQNGPVSSKSVFIKLCRGSMLQKC